MAKLIVKDENEKVYDLVALIGLQGTNAYDFLVNKGYDKTENQFSQTLKSIQYYPIGALYMSFIDKSPSELVGGTWVKIEDAFILGAVDEGINLRGGEETHQLTIEEMPPHTHYYDYTYGSSSGVTGVRVERVGTNGGWTINTHTSGNNQPHNNMPPYVTVYTYERIK